MPKTSSVAQGGAESGRMSSIRSSRPAPCRRKPAVAFAACYRNRPTRIRQAIYRVWDHAHEIGGSRTTIPLLQAIVSCVSRDAPFDPVFAKKEKLAAIAEISEASVYRGLNFLVEAGWIERMDQYRHDDGTLYIGELGITRKLAALLGLVDAIVSTSTDNNGQDQGDSIPPDSLLPNTPAEMPAKLPSKAPPNTAETGAQRANAVEKTDGLSDGYIYTVDLGVHPKASVNNQSTVGGFVRMDGRSIPVELAWLITEERLSYGGLFSLMKQAKTVEGQQLSDFVALRAERLKQLKSVNDCYRYLHNLIGQGLDAKYLGRQAKKAEHRVERKSQRIEATRSREAWSRAHDGRTYSDQATGRTFTINASHGLAIVGKNGMPSNEPNIRINGPFIRAIESGKLQPFVPVVVPRTVKANLWSLVGLAKAPK